MGYGRCRSLRHSALEDCDGAGVLRATLLDKVQPEVGKHLLEGIALGGGAKGLSCSISAATQLMASRA